MKNLPTYLISLNVLLSLLILPQFLKAQDPAFSQFYANPSYLNPAMTAQSDPLRIAMNYRLRKLNSEANFKSFISSLEYQIPESNSGLALQLYSDDQGNGQLVDQRVSLIYAYSIKINRKWSVSAGLQATAVERSLDQSKLVFEDQLVDGQIGGSTAERLNEIDQHEFNMSSGLYIQGPQLFGGFAIHHLNQNDREAEFGDYLFTSERKYTAHAGYKIQGKSKHVSISPNLIYQQQGGHKQFNLGNYVEIDQFTGGIWYSWDQALIVLIGIQSKNFSFGYSVDLNTQAVGGGMTHELSLSLKMAKKYKKRNLPHSSTNCPKF